MKKLLITLFAVFLLAGCSSGECGNNSLTQVRTGKDDGESTIINQGIWKKNSGNPDSSDEWFYESLSGTGYGYPIKTLIYDDGAYEYNFNDGILHRITINKEIPYDDVSDFLAMFGLSKYRNTEIEDTGVSYRAYNCGVHDLWILYDSDEKIIENVKISYSDIFQ